jgi:hypothetical protein
VNISEFEEVLDKGESINTEFKSWVRTSGMKECIGLAVDELIALGKMIPSRTKNKKALLIY